MDVVDNFGENTSIVFDPAVSKAVIMTRPHGKFVHSLFTGRYKYLIFSNFLISQSTVLPLIGQVRRIDKLFARCYKLGYCLSQYSILDIRRNRDMKLWQRISSTNTALSDLLPPQRTRQMRTRSHNYILPKVQTSRFKLVFINRCLFNEINN